MMILYAAIDLKNQKLLLISDSMPAAQSAVNREEKPAAGEFAVLSTSSIILSNAAQAEVSMSYEAECVKESVCTVLREKGLDEDVHPTEFEKLAADIAADAYHDMLKYDVDENYAIDEKMKEREEEISALLAG